jgi:hypothetical protein
VSNTCLNQSHADASTGSLEPFSWGDVYFLGDSGAVSRQVSQLSMQGC